MKIENPATIRKTRKKAESLVINSTGQRPAKENTHRPQAPVGLM
jgi:hypothetical protein